MRMMPLRNFPPGRLPWVLPRGSWSTSSSPLGRCRRHLQRQVKRDDKKAPAAPTAAAREGCPEVRWEGVEGNRQLQVEGSALEVFATWGDPNEKAAVA